MGVDDHQRFADKLPEARQDGGIFHPHCLCCFQRPTSGKYRKALQKQLLLRQAVITQSMMTAVFAGECSSGAAPVSRLRHLQPFCDLLDGQHMHTAAASSIAKDAIQAPQI
jgi:hypothetical protein